MLVLSGEQVVQEGETVAKGDKLIKGQLYNENTRTHMLVRALGIIEARVWYEATGEAYRTEKVLKSKDEKTIIQHLKIFNWKVRMPRMQVKDDEQLQNYKKNNSK